MPPPVGRRRVLALAALPVVAYLALAGLGWIAVARATDPGFHCDVPPGGPGCVVAGVKTGGRADRAGIRPGDEILTVQGISLADMAALERYAQSTPPPALGDALVYGVRRPRPGPVARRASGRSKRS